MPSATIVIAPIGGDLVAYAQCCALDATVFPHASLPEDATRAVFVARERVDAPVLGFAATKRARSVLYVIGLAVDESQRRKGIGRALLDHAEDETRALGIDVISLCVAIDNRPALALYDRAGFEIVRHLKDFYRTGDAYAMQKRVRT